MNLAVVGAVYRRNFSSYFSSPIGYVFITLFVFMSAISAFWSERFFMENLANLDQLNQVMPYLLLFFIPAITMSSWAGERSQGTDELLLTLPATDLEVVIGKYLAALGIYSVSLAFSASHILVLMYLGSPDIGIMLGTYLGYWLVGAMLVSLGLVASTLTDNGTIAFIYGAVLCSFFVFLDKVGNFFFAGDAARSLETFSIPGQFRAFGEGRLLLSGVVYFAGLAAVFVFVNMVVISRRHWVVRDPEDGELDWVRWGLVAAFGALFLFSFSGAMTESDGLRLKLLRVFSRLLALAGAAGFSLVPELSGRVKGMAAHWFTRSVAVLIVVLSCTSLARNTGAGADLTAERLHTLSAETRRIVSSLDTARPVLIQAFVSPRVPRDFVQTRVNLLSTLREFELLRGGAIELVIHETRKYSKEARLAEDNFGIRPMQARGDQGSVEEVYLAVAFTCGAQEDVVVLERGLNVEYELARSVRVVAKAKRKTVGVLKTDAKLMGGFDMKTFRRQPDWAVTRELKRQYLLKEINPDEPIPHNIDALLVALPSSLTTKQIQNLEDWMLAGGPTLLCLDPLPTFNIGLSPKEKRGGNTNPFQRNQGPPPTPKGDLAPTLSRLGLRWDKGEVIWQKGNPHPEIRALSPEVAFLTPGEGSNGWSGFNPEHVISSGLQEVVLLYSGAIAPAAGSPFSFVPLLRSTRESGSTDFERLTTRNFLTGRSLAGAVNHPPKSIEYVVAAQLTGKAQVPATRKPDPKDKAPKPAPSKLKNEKLNVIVLSDLDMIGEQFFQIRRQGVRNFNFDNVTFVLNAVDVLCEDESFIELRKKRQKHRTLEKLEVETKAFNKRLMDEEQKAEKDAEGQLASARKRLDEKVKAIQLRKDLDRQAKAIELQKVQSIESRRFEVVKANIAKDKEAAVERAQAEKELALREIQSGIRIWAVALPPIPALLLALFVLYGRRKRENMGAALSRMKGQS